MIVPNLPKNETVAQPATPAACAKDYAAGSAVRTVARNQQAASNAKTSKRN